MFFIIKFKLQNCISILKLLQLLTACNFLMIRHLKLAGNWASVGQKPTGQKPTGTKARWTKAHWDKSPLDKSPLGPNPTYMHLKGIWLNWWMDGQMNNLSSSQIWNFKHLFLFGTSYKSACLLLLPDQRSFGLIRRIFPNHNRLFDTKCRMIFFKCKWFLTPQLSCLSQHEHKI